MWGVGSKESNSRSVAGYGMVLKLPRLPAVTGDLATVKAGRVAGEAGFETVVKTIKSSLSTVEMTGMKHPGIS